MLNNRNIYPLPTLPSLGPGGYIFNDPTFGSRTLRATDANTYPASVNSSFGTPSAGHQNMFNTDSTRYYARGSGGYSGFIPFDFNPTTMVRTRITGPGSGGLEIQSVGTEPQFSYLNKDTLYVAQSHATNDWPVIKKFDFVSKTYTNLLDLGTVATIPQHTFVGSLFSSAGATERIATIFGADSQDNHYLCAMFDVNTPSNCKVVNTWTSQIRVNGGAWVSTNIILGFHLHHCQISRSGRYVILEITDGDLANGKARKYVWDTTTDTFKGMYIRGAAHSMCGYDNWINGDCCTGPEPYDAVQFQIRDLNNADSPRDVIRSVLRPQETYLDGHYSWNNVTSGGIEFFAGELYRSQDGPNDVPHNDAPWRPLDGEIVLFESENTGSPTQFLRLCHHRSQVFIYVGGVSVAETFWFQPRGNISQDGRFVAFASNWERSLGMGVDGVVRQDMFIVETSASSVGGGGGTTPHTVVRGSSLATNAGSTAVSVTPTAGTTTNDLVFVIVHFNSPATSCVDNNGSTPFSVEDNQAQTSHEYSIFSRRILAGDPSTYNFTLDSAQRWTAVAITIQNPHPSSTYDHTPAVPQSTGVQATTVDAPNITTLHDNAMHFVVGLADGNTITITSTPAGYTVLQNGGGMGTAVCWKRITPAGATGAQTFAGAANSGFYGISFSVRDNDTTGGGGGGGGDVGGGTGGESDNPVVPVPGGHIRLDMGLGGSFRQVVSAKNPIGWWRFSEQVGATSVRDSSGFGMHGTPSGGIAMEKEPFVPEGGGAYDFDGVDDKVELTGFSALPTTCAFEFVIKTNSPVTAGVVLSDTSGANYVGINADRKIDVFFSDTHHLSTIALADQAWAHILVTITSGAGTIYINGVARGTFTGFPGFTPSRIGKL